MIFGGISVAIILFGLIYAFLPRRNESVAVEEKRSATPESASLDAVPAQKGEGEPVRQLRIGTIGVVAVVAFIAALLGSLTAHALTRSTVADGRTTGDDDRNPESALERADEAYDLAERALDRADRAYSKASDAEYAAERDR